MATRNSMAMMAALVGLAATVGVPCFDEGDDRAKGGDVRRDRTPAQSADRITARQERMQRKLARRAAKATEPTP